MTYPVLMSKRMMNKAAMPGGDSMDARETSIAEGFLGVSEAMMGGNEKLGRHLSNRGITVCRSVDCRRGLSGDKDRERRTKAN